VPRIISIITAAFSPVREYLEAARDSVFSQELPAGWDWQWVVQEDGGRGDAGAMLPADPRVSTGASRRAGECVTRNMGLARARGELIKVLDSDDMLAPGALARDIEALTASPGAGWVTSGAADVLADGSTAPAGYSPEPGRLMRGSVLAYWRSHGYRLPVHPATLCMRRELLLALGGWMALPASSDTGLLMAADAVSDGYFVADTGLLYRKWPGQATSQPAHNDPVEKNARIQVIEARALALRSLFARG
jgi:glycosyltransferase involved in cell wall biosynthesis